MSFHIWKDTFLFQNFFSYLERHISFTENPLGISLVSLLLLFCFQQESVLCLDHLSQHLMEIEVKHPSNIYLQRASQSARDKRTAAHLVSLVGLLQLLHLPLLSWRWANEGRLNVFAFSFEYICFFSVLYICFVFKYLLSSFEYICFLNKYICIFFCFLSWQLEKIHVLNIFAKKSN